MEEQKEQPGALLEMEKYNNNVEEMDRGAVTLVVGVATSFREGTAQIVVWASAMHFGFPQRILQVLCGYFEHQRRVLLEGCVAGPLQTTHDRLDMVGSALEDCDAGCDERGLHSVPTAEAESVCE